MLEEIFVQKEKFLVLVVNLKALGSVEKFNQLVINFQRRIFIIMKFELPMNVLSNVIVNWLNLFKIKFEIKKILIS